MGDLLSSLNKRIRSLERRDGASISIQNIMGPVQAKKATLINDWNSDLAAYNGYVWAKEGALHSPDPTKVFTGSVIARTDGSGMQEVWNTDDLNDVRYYMRTFTDDGTGQGHTYSDWRQWATPSGLIELADLGETVQNYLNDLAAEIDTAAKALLFYQQASAPVPGVGGVPAEIPVGSTWLDNDDHNHLYTWDGTSWVSAESTLFADQQADIDALTLAVESAANDAADALDFATSVNKTYRQSSAPTNPDSAGRALVTEDTWFDTSTSDNVMKRWSGSAWTALDASIALDAGTVVTGGTIQTIATAARGVKITSGGLTAYNSSGTATLVINASTGAITMLGALTSGSTIDGAVVTGGTVQTEATASRGIKLNSAGLSAYDSTGAAKFVVDAATGNLTLAGTLTGAGVITGPTLRGGTWETEATAARGIKVTSAGMIAYDSSGNQTLFLDAATGVLTLTGGLLTGGSVTGGIVTGGVLQTDAAALTGIKINSAGFVAYDASTNATVVIDAVTGAVTLRGQLTSTALTSLDGLAIYGSNNYISGSLYVQSTVVPPAATPTIAEVINGTGVTSIPFGATINVPGICPHHSDSNLLVILWEDTAPNPNTRRLYTYNKTTGAITLLADTTANSTFASALSSFAYMQGVAQAGGVYYFYGQNSTDTLDIIQRVTGSTLAALGSVINGQYAPMYASSYHPTIGITYDTSQAATGFMTMAVDNNAGNDKVRVVTYDLTGTLLTNNVYSVAAGLGGTYGFGGSMIAGQLDYGSGTHWVVPSLNGSVDQSTPYAGHWVFSAGTMTSRETDKEWAKTEQGGGICWDVGATGDTNRYIWGTTYRYNRGLKINRYARNPVTEYIAVGYTWADRDTTSGSLTHETTLSPTAVFQRNPRSSLTVSTPPAQASGNTDAGQLDKANMAGLYAATAASLAAAAALAGSALFRQDQSKVYGNATQQGGYSGVDGSGNTVTTWNLAEPIKVTGSAPPATNEFAAISALGKFQSQTYNAGVTGWKFSGDGSLLMGAVAMSAAGVLSGPAFDNYYADGVGAAQQTISATGSPGTDLTNLTVTVTSPGTSAAWVVQHVVDMQTSGIAVAALQVDGTVQPSQALVIALNAAAPIRATGFAQNRVTGLAAGTHTFKLSGWSSPAGSVMGGSHSSISVQRVK
jgi:hypothetical protein